MEQTLPTSIVMRASAAIRHLHSDLAHLLKERHGASVHVFCPIPEDVRTFENLGRDGRFESITADAVMARLARDADSSLTEEDVLPRAQRWEELLGYSLNRLVMTDRHLGRSFSLGAFHHPRSSYSEKSTYPRVLKAVCDCLDFWEGELQNKGIGLVFNPSKELAAIADILGIPHRTFSRSRIGDHYYWAVNEYWENPSFADAFEAAQAASGDGALEAPYRQAEISRQNALDRLGYRALARDLSHLLAQWTYGRLRGYTKARGYYLSEQIKYYVRMAFADQELARLPTKRLSDLKGRPFVYYSLHEEPEITLSIGSPEFTNQLGAISSLARDMPAGMTLAVKETPYGLGKRSDNFYRQICEFKNVAWLDFRERGIDVVREATAVSTIAGTAGFEAAVMGKPVIVFGRHNCYNFIPHVHVVRDEEEIAPLLRDIVEGNYDTAKLRADGARAKAAVLAASFEMPGFKQHDVSSLRPEHVEAAYSGLLKSMSTTGSTPASTSAVGG